MKQTNLYHNYAVLKGFAGGGPKVCLKYGGKADDEIQYDPHTHEIRLNHQHAITSINGVVFTSLPGWDKPGQHKQMFNNLMHHIFINQGLDCTSEGLWIVEFEFDSSDDGTPVHTCANLPNGCLDDEWDL